MGRTSRPHVVAAHGARAASSKPAGDARGVEEVSAGTRQRVEQLATTVRLHADGAHELGVQLRVRASHCRRRRAAASSQLRLRIVSWAMAMFAADVKSRLAREGKETSA